jgi:hypothetical protein
MEKLPYFHEINPLWRAVSIYRWKTVLLLQQCIISAVNVDINTVAVDLLAEEGISQGFLAYRNRHIRGTQAGGLEYTGRGLEYTGRSTEVGRTIMRDWRVETAMDTGTLTQREFWTIDSQGQHKGDFDDMKEV